MQVRYLEITNFRGIEKLEWKPESALTCILGGGDIGKSTILDAIEAVLSPRRQFYDTDFFSCDTTKSITITATIGELPKEAFDENKLGLYLRGWSKSNELHDEPDDDDENVVTVRLTVDDSLEPIWELITDRQEPRSINQKDRGLFGVVRLAADTDSNLAWGHYSLLTRLSADKTQATNVLTAAYRKARELISQSPLEELEQAAKRVRKGAIELGAYTTDDFHAGLDTQRSSTSLATLTLQSQGIPLRLAGLGTRRLIALAVQRLAIPEGAIILIDEVEHGLEPHRIRHVLKVLKEQVTHSGEPATKPIGQILLTTHSSTTVEELTTGQLSIACRSGCEVKLRTPSSGLQKMIRRHAEALLGKRIVVCEGRTEMGLFRGLRTWWASRHDGESIELQGAVLADGNGSQGAETARCLADLGYKVSLFRDSDISLSAKDLDKLKQCNVPVHEWTDRFSTEQRLFTDLSDAAIQRLLRIAYRDKSRDFVKKGVGTILGVAESLLANDDFMTWTSTGRSNTDIRSAIASAAMGGKWYKRIDLGEEVGVIVADELANGSNSPMSQTIKATEQWIYGN